MRVLGIDPGSRVTGYGVIEAPQEVLAWGVIRLREEDLVSRLKILFEEITALITRYQPGEVALEEVIPETFPRSALKLGQAQGAAIIAAATTQRPVFCYHPLEIKKALTGYGGASKEQLRYVVAAILGVQESLPVDASDALAVALYHLTRKKRCW